MNVGNEEEEEEEEILASFGNADLQQLTNSLSIDDVRKLQEKYIMNKKYMHARVYILKMWKSTHIKKYINIFALFIYTLIFFKK